VFAVNQNNKDTREERRVEEDKTHLLLTMTFTSTRISSESQMEAAGHQNSKKCG